MDIRNKGPLLAAAALALATLATQALADGNEKHRYDRHDRYDRYDRYDRDDRRHGYGPNWDRSRAYREGYRDGYRDARRRYQGGYWRNDYRDWDDRRYYDRVSWRDGGWLYYRDGDVVVRVRAW